MGDSKANKPLTWLITGSSSGFGLELTRLAQARGHNVIATSRNPERTPELVSQVVERGGRWEKLEITDLESGNLVERLEAEGVHIDVLVNAAGVGITSPLESSSEAEARSQMEVNYFGPLRLIRAIVPHMRRRRSGMIVNLSSVGGLEAMNTLGLYGASKAALDDMTKVLNKELEPFGVRVLLVYLGAFDTPMASSVQKALVTPDADYDGTLTRKLFDMLSKGDIELPGDHRKACQAIYDVVLNEGRASGLGGEMILPLGRDLANTVKRVQDRLAHMMDVFGDICHDVNRDDVNRDDGTKAPW